MRKQPDVVKNALSGVAAAVIYIVIALLTGAGLDGGTLGFGVLLGVVTFAVSFIITRVISSRMDRRPPS